MPTQSKTAVSGGTLAARTIFLSIAIGIRTTYRAEIASRVLHTDLTEDPVFLIQMTWVDWRNLDHFWFRSG